MPRDCTIAIRDKSPKMYHLPLNHYHGISIEINLDVADNPLIPYFGCCVFFCKKDIMLIVRLEADFILNERLVKTNQRKGRVSL